MRARPFLSWCAACVAALAGTHLSAQSVFWIVAPRYSSATSFTLFAGRIAPHWVAAEELSLPLHSSDWALAVGVGPRLQIPPADILVIVGPVAAAGNAWYAGAYISPTIHAGRITGSGTLELFFPVTAGKHFVYEFSHVRVLATVDSRSQAGLFFHEVKEVGDPADQEVGPSVRMRVAPALKVTADAAWGIHDTPSEIVLTLQWEF